MASTPAPVGGLSGAVRDRVINTDASEVYMEVPSQALIQKIGPVGGHHGTPFNMDTSGISRIVKISIRTGTGMVDGFGVSFIRNGREESAGMWGRDGKNSVEFNLQRNEYITSVKGEFGEKIPGAVTAICKITFETNLGSFGPYGTKRGIPFELPAFGGQIIAFHGGARGSIESFGVYVKVR